MAVMDRFFGVLFLIAFWAVVIGLPLLAACYPDLQVLGILP